MGGKVKERIFLVFSMVIRFYFFLKTHLLYNRLAILLTRYFHYSYLRYFGVETNFGDVKLIGLPIIHKCENSRIILGKNVTLISHSKGNVAGINHPVILATLSAGAILEVGDHVGISGSSICAVKKIIIGNNTGIGANACIYDTDFHALDAMKQKNKNIYDALAGPIEIGEDVWIASNALLLKDIRVGNGSVIGAGSVVRDDVPENTLVFGNPAKVIRLLNENIT